MRAVRVIVIGCGVIGITTALRLRSAGVEVEVWTRDDPAATTSAAAGAIWYPFLAEPRDAVARWSAVTFARLEEIAADPSAGVRMCSVVEAFDEEAPDLWWASAVRGVTMLPPREVPDGFSAAARTTVPVCDVPVHLSWLLDELARAGAALVINSVQAKDLCEEVVEGIRAAGGKAIPFMADVRDPDAVNAMAAAANKEFGGIDIMVHNAAVRNNTSFEDMDLETFSTTVDISIYGMFHLAKAALPSMKKRGGGGDSSSQKATPSGIHRCGSDEANPMASGGAGVAKSSSGAP